jgi:hypothetical protein
MEVNMKEISCIVKGKDYWSTDVEMVVELGEGETKQDILDKYDIGWICGHVHDCCGCFGWNVYHLESIGNNKWKFDLYGRANV